ncbi:MULTISPECIES: PQQ-binding-like beta-propeller repeat protein [unclassified Kaistella]|uniref:outer membrane protein assembly factor BamB family protein n=1 Tax=unclassified Kaistella TaxID=2762626 RepID=UPI002732DD51|nr:MULTISPECIES: PQQ-binding-like beta-propeller repeat protein [unclassified Kaistella]MDP2453810.1 hypothetical protein [Kaistella sp. SH11-4b]MDP2456867.1 hypothetical protein [Kaistella sp. SH40-3]MDP2459623.1 hypothetical protein [Kaistella sp. SH19-2b]
MIKKILSILGVTSLLFAVSCRQDGVELENAASNNNDLILNSDVNLLSKRIDFKNSGILNLNMGLGHRGDVARAGDFPLVLVAELAPPVYEGKTLRATHVAVEGNYAYVSYNTEGPSYLGAIEVIDITNPNVPKLVMQAITPNIDISAVRYDNGELYVAGATDVDVSNTKTAAFVARMTLSGGLLSNSFVNTALPGKVGTDVTTNTARYYAVSGATGTLSQLNKADNKIEFSISLPDLRAVGINGNKIVVLSGTDGVKVFDANGLTPVSSFAAYTDIAEAKRTIDFMGEKLLVSQGKNGVAVYNLNSGTKIQTLPLPTAVPGVDEQDIVTNGVSVNADKVFVANGGAGLYVYENKAGQLDLLGSIDLQGSSNYVMSKGDYIFVASGTGLKIIKYVAPENGVVNCSSYAQYTGGEWLNVNSGQTLEFGGTKSLKGINVNQMLSWCGALTATEGVNVNSNATFNMYGKLYQGSQQNPWNALNINSGSLFNLEGDLTTYGNMTLNSNGTLKVKGNVTIFGDLTLNQGSKIEFVGTGSTITIHGKVTKNGTSTITGTYSDTNHKL